MLTYRDHTVKTSVRRLVEFLCRTGDITTGAAVTADIQAMQEGTRLHRKIQKAQKASYRSEVPLSMSWNLTSQKTGEDYKLILEGRADGIESESEEITLIDEIKCLYRDVFSIEEAEPLHLAQAKCYAVMYGKEKDLSEVAVRITYCNIETEEIKNITRIYSMEELLNWFDQLIDEYKLWAEYIVAARYELKQSITGMQFPFTYRPGQKQMAAIVYRAIHEKEHLFLQAPTGIGKTISALYPALKLLGADESDSIFYLTAKTITRTVAEDTLRILMKQDSEKKSGLKLHSVTITSKERICVRDGAPECNPQTCLRACGHYDRINESLYQLLSEQELITREVILTYAERYDVCPYELGFEAAAFAECIICDYNYVFDPHVNARGLFGETNKKKSILLIDEAHNFLDRARDMYSADLRREELVFIRKRFQGRSPYIVKKIQSVLRQMSVLEKLEKAEDQENAEKLEKADKLYFPLLRLLEPLKDYLKDHVAFEERDEIVQIFFRINHFHMILERIKEGYQIYSTGSRKSYAIHLYCVDPSGCIEEYLDQSLSSIFFSATLLPIHYFRQLLTGRKQIDAFSIPSPFDSSRRLLAMANDVTSRYIMRGQAQYRRINAYLELTVGEKKGNYMIFFPSYEMLSECRTLAQKSDKLSDCDLLIQTPSMSEEEREDFLKEFARKREKSLIGFCVLGSLFSEGIDLVGDQLIGVMIVGTGLPKICKEREIIRTFFDMHGKKGYDYAYRYPGMNKVLQAAGRVIRTRLDAGLILLLDDRFLWRENQELFPQEWDSYYEVSLHTWPEVVRGFWDSLG